MSSSSYICGDYLLIDPHTHQFLAEDKFHCFQNIRARDAMDEPDGYIILDDGWNPPSESEL